MSCCPTNNKGKQRESPERNARQAPASSNAAAPKKAAVPPPQISRDPIADVSGAALDVANALNDKPNVRYALIGGIAARLLGGSRDTADIDILVPSADVAENVIKLLAASGRFENRKRAGGRAQVWYKCLIRDKNHNVDVMMPISITPAGHDLTFPADASGIMTHPSTGAKVLKPALLLNYKCFAYPRRDGVKKTDKQMGDAQDIATIVKYMAGKKPNPMTTSKAEAPHAAALLGAEFLNRHANLGVTVKDFEAIGLKK